MKYEPVIGLEVHIELATKSKMFCTCSADYFGADPNTHTCQICLGMPGAMPKANIMAIKFAQIIGVTLHSENLMNSKFDRKNYFYPDLAKGFQISQYDLPFSQKGSITISVNGQTKTVGITRAHLEEDTGKLTHAEVDGRKVSLIDFNRSGVPLIEVVSEPEMNSSDEAKAYAQKLQQIVRYLGVSDCDMEKGSMRIEPNVSLRKPGVKTLPKYKVELKNINSFRFAQKAIEYEISRQAEILDRGDMPIQETRGWDEIKSRTVSQRSKEEAHDYRYFPEPDLPPHVFTQKYIDDLKNQIPELPDEKAQRFKIQYQLSPYDCQLLTVDVNLADFFEEAAKALAPQPEGRGAHAIVLSTRRGTVYPKGEPKRIANWVIGELLRRLNESQKSVKDIDLLPASLAELLLLVDENRITTASAKEVFEKMITSGKSVHDLVKELGAEAISADKLEEIVDHVIKTNEKAVAEYKAGKAQTLGYLIGQVQRQTQGKADPQTVAEMLEEKLL